MATTNVSSPSKTEVYQALYLICQATQQITDNLERLKAARVLSPAFAELSKTAALQLRAEIATSAVHNLAAPEIADGHRHETKRIRMERRQSQDKPKTKLHKK